MKVSHLSAGSFSALTLKLTIMNFDDFLSKFKKNAPSDVLGVKVNPEALSNITAGDHFFQQANYVQAIVMYTKAINLVPKNWYPLSKRGECYKLTQQYERALEDLFNSQALDDNFENNQTVAECYLLKKDYSKAVGYFETAIKKLENEEAIDNNNMLGRNYSATKARALNNQAICYFQLQQLDKAINCSTRGIKENPNYANNHAMRGIIYLHQGNRTQAISDLQTASRLGDTRASAILSQI